MIYKVKKDFISIIIPYYNCKQWIYRNLDSLVNQTCKEFEVIIVDDGSVDDGLKNVGAYLEENKINFKIIKQKNSGVSVARNEGIKASRGEYLYFLDADDYVELNLCEVLLKYYRAYKADIIFCGYNKKIENKADEKIFNDNYIAEIYDSEEILKDILNGKLKFHMCAFSVKKDIVVNNNIYFTVGSRFGEDYEFIIKSLIKSKKTKIIREVLFNYCIRESSVTAEFNLSRLDSINSAIRVYDYIKNSMSDQEYSKLASKYVIDKIIYNLKQYSNKANYNDKKLKNDFINIIKQNKSHINYYFHKEKVTIKRIQKYMTIKYFLELYINLICLKKIKI